MLKKIFNINSAEYEYFREDGSLASNEEIEAFLVTGKLTLSDGILEAANWSNKKMIDEDREAINEEKWWAKQLNDYEDVK